MHKNCAIRCDGEGRPGGSHRHSQCQTHCRYGESRVPRNESPRGAPHPAAGNRSNYHLHIPRNIKGAVGAGLAGGLANLPAHAPAAFRPTDQAAAPVPLPRSHPCTIRPRAAVAPVPERVIPPFPSGCSPRPRAGDPLVPERVLPPSPSGGCPVPEGLLPPSPSGGNVCSSLLAGTAADVDPRKWGGDVCT